MVELVWPGEIVRGLWEFYREKALNDAAVLVERYSRGR
jgi:hypothetical protein